MVCLLTALTIQNNETIVSTYQDPESGKWGYTIILGEERRFRPVCTYSPVYSNGDIAKQKAHDLITEIRALDLSKEKLGLELIIGKDARVVEKIIEASKANT